MLICNKIQFITFYLELKSLCDRCGNLGSQALKSPWNSNLNSPALNLAHVNKGF